MGVISFTGIQCSIIKCTRSHYLQALNNKLPCSLKSLLFLSVSPYPSHFEKTISMLECSKPLLGHTFPL